MTDGGKSLHFFSYSGFYPGFCITDDDSTYCSVVGNHETEQNYEASLNTVIEKLANGARNVSMDSIKIGLLLLLRLWS